MRVPLAVVLATLALMPGCAETPTDTGPGKAVITLTISPVSVSTVCPNNQTCIATIDATVTLAETAGLGAKVDGFDLVVRNKSTGKDETTLTFNNDWVKTQVGTDRLEPMGRLAMRPVVNNFQIDRANPQVRQIIITARLTDDKGNPHSQSAGLEIAPS